MSVMVPESTVVPFSLIGVTAATLTLGATFWTMTSVIC
jgi:hypothetical protein